MWSYMFIVYPPQDRDTRFTDVTVTNPSINPATDQEHVELARDLAFAYVDQVSLPKPYRIYASEDRALDNTAFSFTVTVQAGD